MEYRIPRIVLAGTSSGSGKTTMTCAVLQALVNRSLRVGAFKCGPDYIDPMFHSKVIGAKSANLDLFFFSENTLKAVLAKNGADREISVMEGVMGFYDGLGLTTTEASTYAVAKKTESPVVLVLNAKGAALSVLAMLEGFLTFRPDHSIRGVLLNQCSAGTYAVLAEEIQKRFSGRVRPLGFLPTMLDCSLESRHLGLVMAAEVQDLHRKLQRLAEQAEKTIDLDGLLQLAGEAPPFICRPISFPTDLGVVRIAVARDAAFCFYYEDHLDALREMGAEIVSFSPLAEETLPSDIQGLYLGGGYPELYAEQLSANTTMRALIKAALERGLPCIAECGGFLYLTESIGNFPMVGFLPGKSYNTGKLTRFGYVRLKAKENSMLCRAGEELPGHEFHYWDCEQTGASFTATKRSGKHWDCVYATDRLYAGFPHFHFYANPETAIRFYTTCREEKDRYAGIHETDGD